MDIDHTIAPHFEIASRCAKVESTARHDEECCWFDGLTLMQVNKLVDKVLRTGGAKDMRVAHTAHTGKRPSKLVCVCVCVCVNIYIYMNTNTHIHTHTHTHHTHTHTYIYRHVGR